MVRVVPPAAAITRYAEYCEQTETPWCPTMGSKIIEVETGEQAVVQLT